MNKLAFEYYILCSNNSNKLPAIPCALKKIFSLFLFARDESVVNIGYAHWFG